MRRRGERERKRKDPANVVPWVHVLLSPPWWRAPRGECWSGGPRPTSAPTAAVSQRGAWIDSQHRSSPEACANSRVSDRTSRWCSRWHGNTSRWSGWLVGRQTVTHEDGEAGEGEHDYHIWEVSDQDRICNGLGGGCGRVPTSVGDEEASEALGQHGERADGEHSQEAAALIPQS